MSYINDALRKAQKEKDNRYGKLDCVPPSPAEKRGLSPQQLLVAFLAIVAIGAVAALPFVKSISLPAPTVQKLPEPLAEAGAVSPVLPEMREPEKTKKPTLSSVAKEKTRRQGVAKPSAANSGKLRDGKKTEEIRRRCEEAALAQRNGNFNRARMLYQEILTLDAGNVQALNNLGVVCLSEKQVDQALALFRQAIALKRDYADPYYNMACLYAQKNDIDQSLWYLKIAISIDKEVKKWVQKDADMKNVVTSPKFKEIYGGAKTDAAGENN